ncbi:MAG: M15 family metallopeptidase [Clostridia bacterium]|nr:M15 family metallopeptidase [Clostridia bacterium]
MDNYEKNNSFDFENDDDVTYQSYTATKSGKKKTSSSNIILAILFIVVIVLVIIVVKNSIGGDNTDDTTTSSTQATTTLPQNFTTLELSQEDIAKGELVLINSKHYYEYDALQGLKNLYDVKTSSYYLKDANTILVNKNIWPAVNALFDGFYEATQKRSINIIGAFRSHTDQMHLFNSYVDSYGSEAEALKHVQKPGYSEHHSGLCIDLQIWDSDKQVVYEFTGEGEYKWLVDNAYKYGFIQRYPEGKTSITGVNTELGHFRYIGVAHATAMKKNNASCYETYIEYLRNFTFDGEHLHVECDNGEKYEIFFSNSLTIQVPTDREYTVSGNNVDGFIVTIKN